MIDQDKVLEKLVNILSDKSLEHVLATSSLFSALDFYSDWKNEFQRITYINHSNAGIFSKLIFESRSNYFKAGKLGSSDLPLIINTCTELSGRYDIFEDDTSSAEEKMTGFIAHMMSSQMWHRRIGIPEKVGLMYSLYLTIPEKYKEDLKAKHKSHYVDIPENIASELGVEIDTYYLVSIFLLLFHFKNLYDEQIALSGQEKKELDRIAKNHELVNEKSADFLRGRLDNITSYFHTLTFDDSLLKDKLPFIEANQIDNYLNLTSASFFKLRRVNATRHYQSGHISQRLNPLENYPIIKLDFPAYIIPNFRIFGSAFNSLLRWRLQDVFKRNQFNEILGSCQEYLILELLNRLGDDVLIIQERSYNLNGSEYKGPDFIIKDDQNRLILIESKAKHVLLRTRLEHFSEFLLEDLSSSINALIKLQNEKMHHIFDRSVYPEIDFDIHDEIILVSVIGEGFGTMQEFVVQLKEKYPNHLINELTIPHTFLDLYSLFECIEISIYNDIPVFDLLLEFWNRANDLKPTESPSDSFGSREYSRSNNYSSMSFDKLVHSISQRIRSFEERE
jgi:hypothetical protein